MRQFYFALLLSRAMVTNKMWERRVVDKAVTNNGALFELEAKWQQMREQQQIARGMSLTSSEMKDAPPDVESECTNVAIQCTQSTDVNPHPSMVLQPLQQMGSNGTFNFNREVFTTYPGYTVYKFTIGALRKLASVMGITGRVHEQCPPTLQALFPGSTTYISVLDVVQGGIADKAGVLSGDIVCRLSKSAKIKLSTEPKFLSLLRRLPENEDFILYMARQTAQCASSQLRIPFRRLTNRLPAHRGSAATAPYNLEAEVVRATPSQDKIAPSEKQRAIVSSAVMSKANNGVMSTARSTPSDTERHEKMEVAHQGHKKERVTKDRRDVIVGHRGRHPGNRACQQICASFLETYVQAMPSQKSRILQSVVGKVTQGGGRFIKESKNGCYLVSHQDALQCVQTTFVGKIANRPRVLVVAPNK